MLDQVGVFHVANQASTQFSVNCSPNAIDPKCKLDVEASLPRTSMEKNVVLKHKKTSNVASTPTNISFRLKALKTVANTNTCATLPDSDRTSLRLVPGNVAQPAHDGVTVCSSSTLLIAKIGKTCHVSVQRSVQHDLKHCFASYTTKSLLYLL